MHIICKVCHKHFHEKHSIHPFKMIKTHASPNYEYPEDCITLTLAICEGFYVVIYYMIKWTCEYVQEAYVWNGVCTLLKGYSTSLNALPNWSVCKPNPRKSLIGKYGFNKQHWFSCLSTTKTHFKIRRLGWFVFYCF